MNTQERDQLTRFLTQLGGVRLAEKNAEAETLIREAFSRQPDAAYLVVQRALLLEQALESAKAQIAQWQSQGSSTPSSSFLGRGNPWAMPMNNPSAGVPGAADYQVPRASGPVPQAQPSGGGSGFLGQMATTAAGVVAGSFLFQGLESLLGHHSSGSSWMGSAAQPMPEETIINNYYDTDRGHDQPPPDDDGDYLAGSGGDDYFDGGDGGDDSDWV